MEDRNPMTDIQNIEAMEAQVQKVKAEQTRCKERTLKNLDRLYEILNGSDENSAEEVAAALPEPAA